MTDAGRHDDAPRVETLLARADGFVDAATGGVVAPIQPSTTFARDSAYRLGDGGYVYGRDDAPILGELDALLAKLEGVAGAVVFPSGMAAVAAVLRTVPAGRAVVAQSGIYWGTTVFLRKFCARNNLALMEVEATDIAALGAAIAATKPDMVLIEVPSNPWLAVADIAAVADIVHAAGGRLAVDATVATPVLMRPADFGADIVIHSASKALNGHSDVLAGVVASDRTDSDWWQMVREERREAGALLGPFEAWLLMRGLRTLALRVERMSENAAKIADFLDAHPGVERVLYPGLAGHPGHALAERQMNGGFGGLLSFLVKGDAPRTLEVAGKLKVITRATSLGGVESLIEHRYSVEPETTGMAPNLLRLSAGIEHVDDLIADLDAALSAR